MGAVQCSCLQPRKSRRRPENSWTLLLDVANRPSRRGRPDRRKCDLRLIDALLPLPATRHVVGSKPGHVNGDVDGDTQACPTRRSGQGRPDELRAQGRGQGGSVACAGGSAVASMWQQGHLWQGL